MCRFWHASIGHFRGHTTSISEFTKIILSSVLQQPSDTSCGHDCHNTLRACFDTGLLVEWSSTARLCQVYAYIPVVCMTSPVQFPGSQIWSPLTGVLVMRMIRCWDLYWGSLFGETSFEVWRFWLPRLPTETGVHHSARQAQPVRVLYLFGSFSKCGDLGTPSQT